MLLLADGDMMEEDKIARRREELLRHVELPPLETILRYPIEVWVSSGKNFVPPEGEYVDNRNSLRVCVWPSLSDCLNEWRQSGLEKVVVVSLW